MRHHTNEAKNDMPFGGCPECGRMSGYRNVGRDHWGYCSDHQMAWHFGSDLLMSWQDETEEDWTANRQFLRGFGVHELNGSDSEARQTGESSGQDPALVSETEAESDHINLSRESREKAWRDALHIAHLGDGYHILEIPGPDGKPFRAWPGPFESEEAADLFQDCLVANAVEGNPNNACCYYGIFEDFNIAGRILAWFNKNGVEERNLACKLASDRPWEKAPSQVNSTEYSDELPF